MKGLFERAAELARAKAAEVRARKTLAGAHHVMQQARDAVQWMTGAEAVALRAALDDAINQSHAILITWAQPGDNPCESE